MSKYVLVMSDISGDRDYYRVEDHWYDWYISPGTPIPEDLIAAWDENDPDHLDLEDGLSTLSILAVDDHHIGNSLADVIAYADGDEIVELAGMWI